MPTTAELDQLIRAQAENIRAQAETIAALTARITSLEDAQRPSSTSSIESSLSALTALQTDQQAILKDVLLQSNTQHATLSALTSMLLSSHSSATDHSTSTKPPSTSDSHSNVLHSLIFPGPTIKSDHFKEIIEVFQQLKKLQQKTKNTSDRFIFDYFMHHAPDVFQSLLSKFRILYSDPTFQFKPPDSQFIGDAHLALFPHPTTNTLHQLLLAWRPDKEDSTQMPTFLISIRTLFRTLPEFFKNFAPQSIMDAIRSLLSPALQHAIDVQRGSVITNDDILPCLIRIQHQHPSSYRNPFQDSHTYPSMIDSYQSRRDPRTSSTPRDSQPPRDSSPRTSNTSTQPQHRPDPHARQNPSRVYNVTLADPLTHGMISLCAYCDKPGHDHDVCVATCQNEDCLASAQIKNPHAHKDCPFIDYYDEEGYFDK